MAKQPDPSRPTQSRHGSVVPSAQNDPSPAPILADDDEAGGDTRFKGAPPESEELQAQRRRRKIAAQKRARLAQAKLEQSKSTQREFESQQKEIAHPTGHPPDANQSINVKRTSLERPLIELPTDTHVPDSQESPKRNLFPVWSMLVSTIIHLTIFLSLAMLLLDLETPDRSIGIIATIDSTPTVEPPNEQEQDPVKIETYLDNESPVEDIANADSHDTETQIASDTVVTPSVVAKQNDPQPAETVAPTSPVGTMPTGGGLQGRSPGTRSALAGERGGTRESEMAVELGLAWIIAHQRKDGSWRFFHDDERCRGQCQNQGTEEASTAATGMALMALLGAGYTHHSGQYKAEVRKGLDYLVKKLRVSPRGGSLTSGQYKMYSHALATIALSEALTMTNDTGLIYPVQEARKYIESAQHPKGGWRYNPGQVGDLSVTGWQLMALKSCELSGFQTGPITYQLAESFVDSLADPSRGYGYLKPQPATPTMTAIGVLSKMYLGSELRQGTLEGSTRLIAEHGPSKTDVYFNYYATQVLHHRHDHAWDEWNELQRNYLVNTQDNSNSHQAGSWYFPDRYGQVGGRLYTTAMSVMILEVYYRYLPLYEEEAVLANRAND
jgi:hypothetical protein